MKYSHIVTALLMLGNSMAATLVFNRETATLLDGTQNQLKYTPPIAVATDPLTYVSSGSNDSGNYKGSNSSIALQLSNIKQTTGTNKQAIAFFDTSGASYQNLYGFAYEYQNTTLKIHVGGFNEVWKTITINDFQSDSKLSLFYNFTTATTINPFYYAVDGGNIVDPNIAYSSAFRFSNTYLSSVTLGDRNSSGNGTWASNNTSGGNIGVIDKGTFTLDYINGYSGNLSNEEMQTLAAQAIPEPASSALVGFGFVAMLMRRRRKHA